MAKWDFPVRGGKGKTKAARIVQKMAEIAEKNAELEALKAEEGNELDQLVSRGIELTAMLEEAKAAYKERDEIIELLLETGETQFEKDGVMLTLVDNFATTNKAWKSVPLNRFCLEITQGVKK
jgi:hypothetical protein